MKSENLLILFLVMGLSACASKDTKKAAAVQQFTGTGRLVIRNVAFAIFKGTYSILGCCVKALGRDVSDWLLHPSERAVLGDM